MGAVEAGANDAVWLCGVSELLIRATPAMNIRMSATISAALSPDDGSRPKNFRTGAGFEAAARARAQWASTPMYTPKPIRMSPPTGGSIRISNAAMTGATTAPISPNPPERRLPPPAVIDDGESGETGTFTRNGIASCFLPTNSDHASLASSGRSILPKLLLRHVISRWLYRYNALR